MHVPPPHGTMATPQPRNSIVVGDVHGCLDELKQLLRDCEYDTRVDQVILVGDLVNKGPASAGVVRYAREQNFLAVFGNHDEAALFNWRRRQALRDRGEAPDGGDKYAYTDDFDAADVAYIGSLPYTLSLPAYDAVVVHAGVVPGVPLESQHLADMYRMRNVARRQGSDGWHALEKGPTAGVGDGVRGRARHVYFGHDAKRKLQRERYATGLDTGCCYGGVPTAAAAGAAKRRKRRGESTRRRSRPRRRKRRRYLRREGSARLIDYCATRRGTAPAPTAPPHLPHRADGQLRPHGVAASCSSAPHAAPGTRRCSPCCACTRAGLTARRQV